MKIVQAIVWVSTNIRFWEMKKHVAGFGFVLAKKPTEGMNKKVEVQEKKKGRRSNDNFFVYIPPTFKIFS